MADQSDVAAALVEAAAVALYPDGIAAAASVTGTVVRIYRGYPANAALEADLAAGISHVAINPVPGEQQPEAPYPQMWEIPEPVAPGLTVSVTAGVAIFAGIAAPGQLAGMLVDDDAFAYRTRPGDTPELVAASLAGLINTIRIATVSGASIGVISAMRLEARVVADQPALMHTRRQRGDFSLTCYCPDPATRDTLAAALDGGLSQISFLPLPDGTVGRLQYVRSDVADELATLPLYRRTLSYSVLYATTIAQTQPSMLFGLFGITDPSGVTGLRIS